MFQVSANSNVFYTPPSFSAFHIDVCTVAVKNIKNMHAVSTNQMAGIFHFNDKVFKKLRKNYIKMNSNSFI